MGRKFAKYMYDKRIGIQQKEFLKLNSKKINNLIKYA